MKVRGPVQPEAIQFTGDSVLVASNVTPYEEQFDGRTLSGYEYDCTVYTKDEYLALQSAQISSLSQELAAAKILLGVD